MARAALRVIIIANENGVATSAVDMLKRDRDISVRRINVNIVAALLTQVMEIFSNSVVALAIMDVVMIIGSSNIVRDGGGIWAVMIIRASGGIIENIFVDVLNQSFSTPM